MPDQLNGSARPSGAGWIGWAARLSAALVVVALLAIRPEASRAQTSGGPVSVDLSVIESGGVATYPMAPNERVTGKLLVPPRRNPVSVLHVAPKSGASTMPPKPQRRSAPVRVKPKPAPVKKAVAAKPPVAESPPEKMEPAPPPPAAAPEPAPVAAVEAAPPPPAPPPPAAVPKAPEPVAAAAPEGKDAADQASLAPATVAIQPGRAMRIEFGTEDTKLPESAKETLRLLADGIKDKSEFRLQLLAYAGAEGLTTSKARRMSLSRALSVRSFLIENGVRSTRLDVRALGTKTDEKPLNRVDVNIAQR